MSSLSTRIMVPVGIGLIITIVMVAVSLSNAFKKSTIETNIIKAKETINQYKVLRSYYTKNVVGKVAENTNLNISFDHRGKKDAIPLPATMIHDLSEALQAENKRGLQLKLYSEFPFPNRKKRVLDSFAGEALAYLEKNPDQIYFKKEYFNNQDYVRVAIADRLAARACVECHNTHPDSPKTDWKLGDVRGVLEVSSPIDYQLKESRQTLVRGVALLILVGIGVLGALFFSVNKIIRPVQSIMDGLSAGADQLWGASQEISSFSQGLSASTTEQASNIEETSSAMEEMASMANQNAEHANSANMTVQESRVVFDAGANRVQEMTQSMAEINVAFQKINKIVRSIDEIAFETNLLSLNASLEASDAGINGKRFSVVADEVRLLSEKASEAAHETVNLIEGANSRVQTGNEIATALKESFDDVENGAAKIANLVAEIKSGSNEQAQGCEHVSRALMQLDQSTQDNASAAEQASSAAEELAAQADQIREIVAQLNELIRGKNTVGKLYNPNGFQGGSQPTVRRKTRTVKLKAGPSVAQEVSQLSEVGRGVTALADENISSVDGAGNKNSEFKDF